MNPQTARVRADILPGELRKYVLVFFGEDFVGFREPFTIGERFSIVDDYGGEAGQRHHDEQSYTARGEGEPGGGCGVPE